MTNYTMQKIQDSGCTLCAIYNEDTKEYFAGYDFMGSVDWVQNWHDAKWMVESEACQIKADLESADADDSVETVKYEVDFTDSRTGATSPIDTVVAPEGYTAEQYLNDCRENGDQAWIDMLEQGTVKLVAIDD